MLPLLCFSHADVMHMATLARAEDALLECVRRLERMTQTFQVRRGRQMGATEVWTEKNVDRNLGAQVLSPCHAAVPTQLLRLPPFLCCRRCREWASR